MTTAVEARKWTKTLIKSRDDLVLRGRSLNLTPTLHIHRNIFFEGSSDRTDPRPRWYIKPLFTPSLPVHVWSGYIAVGHSTDDGFPARVAAEFAKAIDGVLKPTSSIEAFCEFTRRNRLYEAFTGPPELERNPAYHACVLAALGRLEEAAAIAEREIEPSSRLQEKVDRFQAVLAVRPNDAGARSEVDIATSFLTVLMELKRLAVVAQRNDRVGVATLLYAWEDAKVKRWGIEDLWQPTPFPIQLGAGD